LRAGQFLTGIGTACEIGRRVEGVAKLIERARANAHRNGIGNAQFHQADLAGPDLSHMPWLKRAYSHLLLDPPRLGAREMLPAIARLAPRRLLYVSCHPGHWRETSEYWYTSTDLN